MQKIKLKNIKIYAYHGCLEEEAKIGSFYIVNVTIRLNLEKSGRSDELNDTVNYGIVAQIVKDQMAIRSNLLEHVANRIIREIKFQCKKVKAVKVSVAKVNPPLHVNLDHVKVTFKKKFY
ncbi:MULTISPECIES: dihydroneopterin aldolase [Apibacter]|uniref:dihydroneopterin aldolase n=1 Tax=Apibacter TaxID=1778601 RepID=UPI001C69BB42|nr:MULTISPECIES: dihydroneopterin aldolase [Apibacter]QYN51423.1 dihydroneopterin aldolase [Apibacter sp. ESL0404]